MSHGFPRAGLRVCLARPVSAAVADVSSAVTVIRPTQLVGVGQTTCNLAVA